MKIDLEKARKAREVRFRETYRMWLEAAPKRVAERAKKLSLEDISEFFQLLTAERYREVYDTAIEQLAEKAGAVQVQAEKSLKRGIAVRKEAAEKNRKRIVDAADKLIAERSIPYSSTAQLARDIQKVTKLGKTAVQEHMSAAGIRIKK